jgi:hypothetical protein
MLMQRDVCAKRVAMPDISERESEQNAASAEAEALACELGSALFRLESIVTEFRSGGAGERDLINAADLYVAILRRASVAPEKAIAALQGALYGVGERESGNPQANPRGRSIRARVLASCMEECYRPSAG